MGFADRINAEIEAITEQFMTRRERETDKRFSRRTKSPLNSNSK